MDKWLRDSKEEKKMIGMGFSSFVALFTNKGTCLTSLCLLLLLLPNTTR